MTVKVEYHSNNSGGSPWLSDKDWLALEAAGWEVVWGNRYFCGSTASWDKKPEGKPEPCAPGESCNGHRKYDSLAELEAANDRWLDAPAWYATKIAPSMREAVEEFERVTGQDASAEGCNCCGRPHEFSGQDVETNAYADGPRIVRESRIEW